ncbi:hypothetical protein [Pseudorhodoplanes sp.]|uniref:hypothetical protein n=1 Tax=Pseudorhodoplanes sp. TaxID=1934341 RepID=UPI002BCA05C9|nr:hypothetical protein [Pseudorhodoplanes sp.]HWV41226.1 hypothetical protein [Pseudorhodoplanes sp.]
MKATFAIAPNFHCKGSWSDRLLVQGSDGWRAPNGEELAALTTQPPADDGSCIFLFSVPMHLRSRFWAMLNEEAAEGQGDFISFSDDVAAFLTFKDFAPPADAVCELLVQDAAGQVATADMWGLINFGEEPVQLAFADLQLRLDAGEGCRLIANAPADVVPPAGEELNVLYAIRTGVAADDASAG